MKNVKEYTRAQACKIIAGTSDMDLIKSFSAHENKHVKAYVEHKLNKLMNPEPVEEVDSVEEVTQVEEVRVEKEKTDTVLAEKVVAAVAEELEMIDTNSGKTELDLLVERFTKEGKKNPLASARASLAARAQAEKRRAAKAS